MKCMVIVALAFVAVAHAKPYFFPGGMRYGLGFGGLGYGGYGSGGGYGDSGYAGGQNGYGNRGYFNHLLNTGHDIGGQENDYDSAVHSHQASSHNVGGMTMAGGGGHRIGGYGNYGMGHRGYGNDWNNGYNGYGI